MPTWIVLVAALLAGALPFSYMAARVTRDVDLREHGGGTVSGTGLYEVAGFGPMVVGGLLDVGKGAVGPLLAGDRPVVAAVAAGLVVAGHNWSPFLRGAGGRGISPAMGALAIVAWPGTLLLLAGMALGKLAGATGLGSFVSQVVLAPFLAVTDGWHGALAGVLVVVPLWVKRVLGNRPPAEDPPRHVRWSRLLFDRDDAFAGEVTHPGPPHGPGSAPSPAQPAAPRPGQRRRQG